MSNSDLPFLLALYSVDRIGPFRLRLLMEHFGTAKKAWEAAPGELISAGLPQIAIEHLVEKRKQLDPKAYLNSMISQGIKVLTFEDEEYPRLLREIPNPPPLLFAKGNFKKEDGKALAVIGTRTPSFYGRQVTEILVGDLLDLGFTIVSGLARGIDSVAHKAALKSGGRTIAVLGSGIDVCYPPENNDLMEKIARFGAVVSQFPPGTQVRSGLFPARNRLISGLSLGVLVTEAAQESGTKITAEFARKQKRPVFAVPGPITSRLSRGANELIQMGATLVYGVEDILGGLKIEARSKRLRPGKKEVEPGSREEEALLKLLGQTPVHIDELVRQSSLSTSVVGSTLSLMEIRGWIKDLGDGKYIILST